MFPCRPGPIAVRSLLEIMAIPAREASTPKSFRQVNFSMPVKAPINRVHMDEVDVRMVVDATVVYCKQAMAK